MSTNQKETPGNLAIGGGSSGASGKATFDAFHITKSNLESQGLTYTQSVDLSGKNLRRVETTWGNFVANISSAKEFPSKEACPLISGATFGELRSEKNSLRHGANVQSVCAVIGDYDGECISPMQAAAMLQSHGVLSVVVTTASHTEKAPRWRVIAPLSAACSFEASVTHTAALNWALGGILACESFAKSQMFFVGRAAGALYEVHEVEGEPIDENLFVGSTYPGGADAPVPFDPSDALATIASAGPGLHDAFMRLTASFVGRGHGPDVTEAAVMGIAEKNNNGTARYRARMEEIPELVASAFKKYGKKQATTADGLPDMGRPLLADVLQSIQLQPADVVRATWAGSAAELGAADADEVRQAVHRITGTSLRTLSAGLKEARANRKRERVGQTIGDRLALTHEPENSARQAAEVEAQVLRDAPVEDLVIYAGRPSRITDSVMDYSHKIDSEGEPPDPVPLIEVHSEATLRALVEAHAVFQLQSDKGPTNIAVPTHVIAAFREMPSDAVPRVTGTLGHPIALHNGDVLDTNGLHRPTGLFVHGVSSANLRPYSRAEAGDAWERLSNAVLDGFDFASKLDRHIALAGLLTAIQRRVMDSAPGMMILAPIQSSGKTTLARRIYAILTGRDMPVLSLPVGDDAEIEKRLLAVLVRSPLMVCFDNIPDGWTVNCGAGLNMALTAPTFEGRLLGSTQILQVPTNTFFCATGNNLSLGKDEVTRWLTTTLAPGHARPQERKFRHPDVIGHALSIRNQLLRDAVGIIAGYLKSGDQLSMATATRFPQWDRMVRRPIVWAGGDDVAASFLRNVQDSEHDQALRVVLRLLYQAFGDSTFNARAVCDLAGGFSSTLNPADSVRLADAMEGLKVAQVAKPKSVGRGLAAVTDRPVDVDGVTLRLHPRVSRDGGLYLVQKCGV